MSIALNWIDYGFITLFLLSIIAGFARGFVREIVSLIALVAAVYVAMTFSPQLAAHFAGEGQTASNLMLVTCFLLLFVGVIVVGAFVGYLLNLMFQFSGLGFANRFLGGLFGFIRAAILSIVVVFVVQLTDSKDNQTWQESKFVVYFQPWADWLSKNFAPAIEGLKDKMNTSVQSVTDKVNTSVEQMAEPKE